MLAAGRTLLQALAARYRGRALSISNVPVDSGLNRVLAALHFRVTVRQVEMRSTHVLDRVYTGHHQDQVMAKLEYHSILKEDPMDTERDIAHEVSQYLQARPLSPDEFTAHHAGDLEEVQRGLGGAGGEELPGETGARACPRQPQGS